MDTASLERMAQIALTICRVNMADDQRKAAKGFSDCHDCFDANVALFGAYCGEYFASPLEGDESEVESNTETLNRVADMVDSMIKKGDLK